MEKPKPLNYKKYQRLIRRAIKELKNGDSRFDVSGYPFKYVWIDKFFARHRIIWNYEVPSKSIGVDYFEEITMLEKLLVEANVPVNIYEDLGERLPGETIERDEQFNRHVFAIQLWDWYSIPLRYKDNKVHVIWISQGIFWGTEIIRSYQADFFLTKISSIFENQAKIQAESHKKTVTIIIFVVVIAIIIVVF